MSYMIFIECKSGMTNMVGNRYEDAYHVVNVSSTDNPDEAIDDVFFDYNPNTPGSQIRHAWVEDDDGKTIFRLYA